MTTQPAKPRPQPFKSARGRGPLITDDSTCTGCGYSLKGLFAGNPCPECGKPIQEFYSGWGGTPRRRRRSVNAETLGRAPKTYLAPFITSCFALAISGTAIPVLFFLPLFQFVLSVLNFFAFARGTYRQISMPVPQVAAVITNNPVSLGAIFVLGFAVCVWFLANLCLLRPIPGATGAGAAAEAIDAPWWLRRAIIISQAAWLALPAMVLLIGPMPRTGQFLAGMCVLVGTLGMPLVAWQLALLADWASDSFLGTRLRGSAIGMGICFIPGILMVITGTLNLGVFNLFMLISGVLVLALGACYGSMLLGAFSMASMAAWAVENAYQADMRDVRMAERARRNEAAAREREAAAPPVRPADETLLAEVLEPAQETTTSHPANLPRPGQHLPGIQSRDDTEPYRLEN